MRTLAVAMTALATAACSETLAVDNTNNPDVIRVFTLPATIEQTLGSGYQQCRNTLHSTGNVINVQLLTLAFESYSQLNNFNMGPRGALPRAPILNNRSASSILNEFSQLQRQARTLIDAIGALDKIVKEGGTTGTVAQDLRARAWGWFVVGCNLGYSALVYDSAGIVKPGLASGEVPVLSPYTEVMKTSLAYMDSALAVANDPVSGGTGGFPTPSAWLSGASLSRAQFIELVRSYKARFRAEVARNPTERAAADWDAIIADANAGLKADIMVTVGGTSGWNIGFEGNQMHVDAGWSQVTPMIIGMADTSGAYDGWLAKPLTQRDYILIQSPDKRLPQGTTRAAQRTASPNPSGYLSRPYISNRTGTDTPGDAWGTSYYNFHRFRYIALGSNTGSFPEFLKTEVDLLAAEGYLRKGNIADAAKKIDLSRTTRGELPALFPAVTSATQAVPGGGACVPRVPQGPSYTTTACGTIFEALKWEKRLETAFQKMGAWYFDARGWNDLAQGTAVEYPVPFQELDARGHGFYDLGGGGRSSAPKGTYGF